jgi:ferredoxin
MRIEVDRDRCIGSGNCSFYAGATFDLDGDLKVMVLAGAERGGADADGDIRAAAEGCPVKAITIQEGNVAGQVDESIKGDEPDQKAGES